MSNKKLHEMYDQWETTDQTQSFENYLADRIRELGEELETERKLREKAEARIDALMQEYCPDEMTKEQWERWEKNQVSATDEETADLLAAADDEV